MEDLAFAATDPIPGIGAIVSFTLGATTAATQNDPAKAVGYALEGFEDILRDGFIALSFLSGQPELIPWIAVARDAVAGLTQAGVKLLFERQSPAQTVTLQDGTQFTLKREANKLIAEPVDTTITGQQLQEKVLADLNKHYKENPTHKYGAVVMPHESNSQAITNLKNKISETKVKRRVKLYGALFTAKLDYADQDPPQWWYSKDDNLFLTFPTGLRNGDRCLILTEFQEDAKRIKKRPMLIIDTPMEVTDKETGGATFKVIPKKDGTPLPGYGYKGEVNSDFNQITELKLLIGGEEIKAGDVSLATISNINLQKNNWL
ncbi:hypothetical protein MY11210_008433 [Beauveria gryllotalpidicola]